MKNNYSSGKNHRTSFVVLLLLFFGLFANKTAAQAAVANNDTFIWTGTNSTVWADAANWSILRGTTVAGTNIYPGEIGTTDVVFINKSDAPFAPILDAAVYDILRLNVANTFGGEAGATFTINAGAILNVGNSSTTSNNVQLNGGNIVNNGALNIIAAGAGFSSGAPLVQYPSIGINCGNPPVLPTVPREYTYSGSGTLSISLPIANFAGAAAIAVTGNSGTTLTPTNNANVTYRIVLNNPEITLNQTTALGISVLRGAGGANANKMIIAGTGLTVGTVATPSIGSLVNTGGGSSIVIEAGTTLNFYSAATNLNSGIGGFSTSTFAADFTNKGTINILGSSARSGLNYSTGASGTASVFNINNEGTLNVNMSVITPGSASFSTANGGGGTANAGSAVNLNNSGTMTLKNTSTAIGTGFSIYGSFAGEAPRLVINNSGTMTLDGTTYNSGNKTTFNNSNILNTNGELRGFSAVNNNLGGTINFVRNAATATTRQVTFTVTNGADLSGGVGSIYRDSNNNDFAVVVQKFGNTFTLVANVVSGATVAPSGNLTRISTTAGTATIAYTAVAIPALNNAIVGTIGNSGTINTDTAANLNIISAPTTTATSVLSPGGATGKGILTIPTLPSSASFTFTLNGSLRIQASGSATAGVDYDMMQVTGVDDFIDISAATLDVTGLYTPTVITTLDIITTGANGGFVGSFASVVGLPAKWTVVYVGGIGGKVQLVYNPNLATNKFAEAQFSYYPNPTRNELNLTAAKNISTVEMFNLLGQKVLSNTVDANQKQLNLSSLQNGLYLMEVTIDNVKESFKIVKQ